MLTGLKVGQTVTVKFSIDSDNLLKVYFNCLNNSDPEQELVVQYKQNLPEDKVIFLTQRADIRRSNAPLP